MSYQQYPYQPGGYPNYYYPQTSPAFYPYQAQRQMPNQSKQTKEKIVELSEWFETENKPEQITSSIPFHYFPEEVQEEFLSEDLSTLLFHVSLEEGIEASETNAVMDTLRDKVERSEERRVGRECRWRWAKDEEKKKQKEQ